jgi:hypothetical protein
VFEQEFQTLVGYGGSLDGSGDFGRYIFASLLWADCL